MYRSGNSSLMVLIVAVIAFMIGYGIGSGYEVTPRAEVVNNVRR